MNIYGLGLLAFCYLSGQLVGDILGNFLNINANIGGVGFAMIMLVLLSDYLKTKGLLKPSDETGIHFWGQLYIPIVVAIAATQNVKAALSSGFLAILAGIIPAIVCLACIPFISKLSKKN